jgi:hypothetical protein
MTHISSHISNNEVTEIVDQKLTVISGHQRIQKKERKNRI